MHELAIFDCDGVLVDSEVISNEVLARMLTREGLPTTLREARRGATIRAPARRHSQPRRGEARPLVAAWLAR